MPVIPIEADNLIQSSVVKFAGWAIISPPTLKNFSKSLSVKEGFCAKPTE